MKRKRFEKKPISSTRIRTVPASGFSWVDRRFVRDGFVEHLPPEAILLYFFLVAVGDAQGLSFYAEPTISKILKLDHEDLVQARARLVDADLILYRYPLYQVLSLPERGTERAFRTHSPACSERGGDPVSLREILQAALKHSRGAEDQRIRQEKHPE